MRINLLSSFAAGILISTTICGAVYLFDHSEVRSVSAKSSGISNDEMKERLLSSGYVVQTQAEYDKKMQASSVKTAPPKDTKSTEAVTRVVVNVTQGMTSIDVGNMLVKAAIIPNAYNFSTDIEKKGLQNNLRPGTFVVDSGMTYDQVIATIFEK